MVEVSVNKDIRKNETKFIGSLTLRQTIALAIAASYSIPLAMVLKVDITIRIIVPILAAIPVAMCGWIKPFGMPFEFFVARFLYLLFLTPPKRKVKQLNTYREGYEKLKKRQEDKKTQGMTKKEKEAYIKEKERPVKRSGKKQYKVYT